MTLASLLAGRLLHRVERGERPLAHVIVEALWRKLLVGIDPGDHEHGVALAHRPADEGVLRAQIEDVKLVDPRRDDQQRPPLHRLGRRRVLDQLHQIVLVDDLARRGGDVLAELERRHVGHLDRQAALAALQIVEQVLQSVDQVLAAAFDRRAQHLGVGQHEIRRRHRVDELARVEIDLARRSARRAPRPP